MEVLGSMRCSNEHKLGVNVLDGPTDNCGDAIKHHMFDNTRPKGEDTTVWKVWKALRDGKGSL